MRVRALPQLKTFPSVICSGHSSSSRRSAKRRGWFIVYPCQCLYARFKDIIRDTHTYTHTHTHTHTLHIHNNAARCQRAASSSLKSRRPWATICSAITSRLGYLIIYTLQSLSHHLHAAVTRCCYTLPLRARRPLSHSVCVCVCVCVCV